ncbi:MAG: right-handed parallel beta-helix repeat-containing protein [Deltaproteobacteria bacterium]|nr:right-handed parallel beta-helix repeat-containing protein [Deltaproteobacteria bacterium]
MKKIMIYLHNRRLIVLLAVLLATSACSHDPMAIAKVDRDTASASDWDSDSDSYPDSGGDTVDSATARDSDTSIDTSTGSPPTGNGCVVFVKQGLASYDESDGSSWDKAFENLQQAVNAARADIFCEIWVAAGKYIPIESTIAGDERSKTFILKKPTMSIYGGFAGTETLRTQRNIDANPTILSGDLQGDDDPDEETTLNNNSYHVVTFVSSCRLDGFTVEGGYADLVIENDATMKHQSGGGIISFGMAPTIENCTIRNNVAQARGGGVYLSSGFGGKITGCTFDSNRVYPGTGASIALTAQAGATIDHSIFRNNSAPAGPGGGIFVAEAPDLKTTNCVFLNNYAQAGAAFAIYNKSNNVILDGNTFYRNEVPNGGAAVIIAGDNSNDLRVSNSIFFGNIAPEINGTGVIISVSNNLLQTPCEHLSWLNCSGPNITGQNPVFRDANNGDFGLMNSSPCIDAGDASLQITDVSDIDKDTDVAESVPLDYLMQTRVVDGDGDGTAQLDIGAVEYVPVQ